MAKKNSSKKSSSKNSKKKKTKQSKQAKKPGFVFSLKGVSGGETSTRSLQMDLGGGIDADLRSNVAFPTRTGRVMVVSMSSHKKDAGKSMLAKIKNVTGMGGSSSRVCRSSDYQACAIAEADAATADVVYFEEFGIAFLNNAPAQRREIEIAVAKAATAGAGADFIFEPERVNYSLGFASPAFSPGMTAPNLGRDPAYFQIQQMLQSANYVDTADSTWGLKASNVVGSSLTGSGIKVAVIDSGFDLGHPDFTGRSIETFVNVPTTLEVNGITISQLDSSIQDIVGHGTHCAGTACGPVTSSFGPRYGVATDSEMFIAKVMFHHPGRATGVGFDMHIMDGIRMAMQAGSDIISMSFGSTREPGDPPFVYAYERIAALALQNNQLLVAAAGNDSQRHLGIVREVGGPANCPSIVGVAAVKQDLQIAYFSNGQAGNQNNGAEVNLCAAGVQVQSCLPILPSSFAVPNRRTETFSGKLDGTSMATPHVSGIAALVAEATGLRGLELYRELRSRARAIGPQDDFGHGLVQL